MKVFLLLPKNNAPGQIISVGGSSLEAHFCGAHLLRADYLWRQIFSGANNLGVHVLGAEILQGDVFLFLLSCNSLFE